MIPDLFSLPMQSYTPNDSWWVLKVEVLRGIRSPQLLPVHSVAVNQANLARATMPQRRRPRKAARPFKAAVAGAETTTAPNTSTTGAPSSTTTTQPSTEDTPPPQAEPSTAPAADVLQNAVAKPMSAAQRLAAAAAAERNDADGPSHGESDEEWN